MNLRAIWATCTWQTLLLSWCSSALTSFFAKLTSNLIRNLLLSHISTSVWMYSSWSSRVIGLDSKYLLWPEATFNFRGKEESWWMAWSLQLELFCFLFFLLLLNCKLEEFLFNFSKLKVWLKNFKFSSIILSFSPSDNQTVKAVILAVDSLCYNEIITLLGFQPCPNCLCITHYFFF